MTGYIYDADGERVGKGAISVWSCDPSVNGFSAGTDYVRDQSGRQLSEIGPNGQGSMVLVHANVYAAGALFATDDDTETHFYLNDWLGTRRVQTSYAGVAEQDCASLPYGDSETCGPTPAENLYTGKERDAETAGGVSPFGTNQGNDYFGARYYSSVMGRWMSPDYGPGPVPFASFTNPQSLNLYGYVGNNPVSLADPSGHACVSNYEDTHCGAESLATDFKASLRGSFYSQFTAAFLQFGAEDTAQQQGSSSGGGGFWSHVGNLLHGHSWNYGMRFAVTHRILPAEPIPAVTAVTDVVGIAATATKNTPLGIGSAIVSTANNPSTTNTLTNGLGLIPGFGWPMAITGAFNDWFDYGADHNRPGPQKVGDPTGPQDLHLELPTQDAGCQAAGLNFPC